MLGHALLSLHFVGTQNPFILTTGSAVTAGTPFNITWSPDTGTTDTITLVLRNGSLTSLETVESIACTVCQSPPL
jgi:hypothetical protein